MAPLTPVDPTPAEPPKPERRRPYHHGDLRRALIEEALRTIEAEGVAGLTLRQVGDRLGVSRTALYRHFADKSALLAAVAREGFRAFRQALTDALASAPSPQEGFAAMGAAYVRFAVTHPAHYRVMFGGFLELCGRDPALLAEADASFQVLVDAIKAQQAAGVFRWDDPRRLARYVWSLVHGIAMLSIDGPPSRNDLDAEVRYAFDRLRNGIDAPRRPAEWTPSGLTPET